MYRNNNKNNDGTASMGTEGLGGQVQLDSYTYKGIDPSLEDCCRREVESNRKYNALTSTLRRHDTSLLAERRRRNIIHTEEFDGCRCCYDPNADGGEYAALAKFKAEKNITTESKSKKENGHNEDDDDEEKKDGELDVTRAASIPNQKQQQDTDDDDDSDDDEFDYLLDEDLPDDNGELKAIENRRREELEYEMMVRQFAKQHGYGIHRQIHPLRVLKAAGLNGRGTPPFVVLHLVDPSSRSSASLDYLLETVLATEHAGTVFLRSGGEKTLQMDPTLSHKALPSTVTNPDTAFPALIAIREGVVVNACPRLEGLLKYGYNDDVEEEGEVDSMAVREWLDRSGVLVRQPPPMDVLCFIPPAEEALMDSAFIADGESKEERYDCGVEGCNKCFKHEHVGVETSQQSGLVVTEEEIVNGDI